jgi:hypothetical protein
LGLLGAAPVSQLGAGEAWADPAHPAT